MALWKRGSALLRSNSLRLLTVRLQQSLQLRLRFHVFASNFSLPTYCHFTLYKVHITYLALALCDDLSLSAPLVSHMRFGRLGKIFIVQSGTDASIIDPSSYSLISMPHVCQGTAFYSVPRLDIGTRWERGHS
ncbi:hypothetical protein K437DRAFT_252890 [Tilletiaria anomala UBC 951]|uniref:Uncharacterized protein n=1 Tax=Tilletiaria anomala (strain ATCC 24038 / CBS 436.72 / UBC 951) TaxID=1037660 RepID=A0A066WLQ4_TILAU|nr:uncharacterized protein K437DRAFT_252890 [Tilletiaria anomala UBC 951]KDN53528.1 hypothetical protein K437DRAFT_252890 [Tilletiaria anomala UBC 951]